jgi:hypothetical protein
MSRMFNFKKLRDLEWEAKSEHHSPTPSALDYYFKRYSDRYPSAYVTILIKKELWDGLEYFCIKIVFENESDEAEFMVKESN